MGCAKKYVAVDEAFCRHWMTVVGTPAEITGHNDTQVSMMILLMNWFTINEIGIVYCSR